VSQTIEIESIARLDVKPGETLVVTMPYQLSRDDAIEVQRTIQDRLPDGVDVLVVPRGVVFNVVALATP
jgi:hypothetical protein